MYFLCLDFSHGPLTMSNARRSPWLVSSIIVSFYNIHDLWNSVFYSCLDWLFLALFNVIKLRRRTESGRWDAFIDTLIALYDVIDYDVGTKTNSLHFTRI